MQFENDYVQDILCWANFEKNSERRGKKWLKYRTVLTFLKPDMIQIREIPSTHVGLLSVPAWQQLPYHALGVKCSFLASLLTSSYLDWLGAAWRLEEGHGRREAWLGVEVYNPQEMGIGKGNL